MPTAYISLGSNIGDREHYLRLALTLLDAYPEIQRGKASSLYRSEAVTHDGRPGPEYRNAVCAIRTSLLPLELLQRLRSIENRLGRLRHQAWGPRTIDLDLLDYQGQVLRTPVLRLPHPDILQRDFVLAPLREIAPYWRHPECGRTANALWEELALSAQGAKLRGCCGSLS